LPNAEKRIPEICKTLDGVELCRLIRKDSTALDIVCKIVSRCFFEKQRNAFLNGLATYDASICELPDVLISLAASLEGDVRNENEKTLLDTLISVFTLSYKANLDDVNVRAPSSRFISAKRLLELFNKYNVTVLNTLREAKLAADTDRLPIILNLEVAKAALDADGINAISAALSSSEKAYNLSSVRGNIVLTFHAAMLKICAIARSVAYNAESVARSELITADLVPCVKLLDTYKRLLDCITDFDEKTKCSEIFISGTKRFGAILSGNNGKLLTILREDSLGKLLLSGEIESYNDFKKSAFERIIPKELPKSLESELSRSPQILSPKYLDRTSFLRPYYMATLDSELCANKQFSPTDIEASIFKKLLSGQKVLLTVNQLCDNSHILHLAEKPWFIRLLRSGDIVISYYHIFNNLTDYAAHQLQSSFKWSSMPFLNSTERKAQALRLLRGDSFDATVFDRPEAVPTLRIFKECLSIIDMSISSQSICYYYQRPGNVDIYALLQENITNFYSTRGGEAFRDIKFIHQKIDDSIRYEIENTPSGINKKYTRTEYVDRIDRINCSDFSNMNLSAAEMERLSRLAGTDAMTAVRDIVSDEYNYILGGLSSKYREHCYHSPLFVPTREDKSFSFRDIMNITELGAAIDGDALVDYIDELRAKIYEENMRAETLAANLNRNWNSAGIDFGIDAICGEFYVDNMTVKSTENKKANIQNTTSANSIIHLQTGGLVK